MYFPNHITMSAQKETVKEYTNGEVTIVWKPELCMHSALCVNGLPEVFNPDARPWINAEGAATNAIVEQVKKCPSGALTFYYNEKEAQAATEDKRAAQRAGATEVEVVPNGPLMVKGTLALKHADGRSTTQEKLTAFCRCGASANKPFCDGTHKKINFRG